LGGLGISDLARSGIALRVRWVWNDHTEGRAPASKERAALALFQAATTFNLGNGKSTFFWTDRWLHGKCIQAAAPTLFAALCPRKIKSTVHEALQGNAWVHLAGSFTAQFLLEFSHLCDLLEDVQLSDEPDTFSWRFSKDHSYSAASTYGGMFLGSSPVLGAKLLWKTAAPHRVRFFFWLCLHGRCWTGDRRFQHGLQPSNLCVMCNQEPETMDHILIGCSFSREVWHIWLRKLHLDEVVIVSEEPAIHWWLRARKLLPKALRRGFDSFVFLVGWMIWKEWNERTFNGGRSSPLELAQAIGSQGATWVSAGCRQLALMLSTA
jgi:hypothetical protein